MYPEKVGDISIMESQEITGMLVGMFSSELTDFLIYKDSNYPAYFEKLINHSLNDYLFVIRKGSMIGGFAHFKIIKDEIFLNNIGVQPELRNAGTGTLLLKFSFNFLLKERNCKYLSLDVFEKNSLALNWYKKLGMREIGKKYWYNVFPEVKRKNNFNLSATVKDDINGFTGLYSYGLKIATVINDSLLFRDYEAIDLFPPNKISNFSKAVLITEKTFNYELIDRSLRLAVETDKIRL